MTKFDPTTRTLRSPRSWQEANGLGNIGTYLARGEKVRPDLFSRLSEETVIRAFQIIELAEANDYDLKRLDPRAFLEKVINVGFAQGIKPRDMHNLGHLWCQMKADDFDAITDLGTRDRDEIKRQIFSSFPKLTPPD